MKSINRIIVSAVILSSDNRILLGMQNPNKPGVFMEYWHIPGGGLEDGESKLEGLHREIMEEVGLDIKNENIEFVGNDLNASAERKLESGEIVLCHMNYNDYLIRMSKKSSEIILKPTDDLIDLTWFSFEELKSINLPESIKSLLVKLGYY